MIILGYFSAILMGLTLGLIGAGGSILTVPILVFFFKTSPLTATAYSLLIVGITALVGAISYHKRKLVDIKSAAIFALPAMLAVLTTRTIIIPSLAVEIFGIPRDTLIMLLFSALMLVAAFFMLSPETEKKQTPKSQLCKNCILIFSSSGIGLLTGLVGAGGGFLIIPALTILFNLPIKTAIGTSLTIIAFNSLIGFKGDLISGLRIEWHILAPFIFLTILGMLLGIVLSKNFDSAKLKKTFAIFIAIVAIAIFANELLAIL